MIVDPALEARFPAEALERVTVLLRDGRQLGIGPLGAPGDAGAPPSDEELQRKHDTLTAPVLGEARAARLRATVDRCAGLDHISELTDLLGAL
jgi:hypothetical protein